MWNRFFVILGLAFGRFWAPRSIKKGIKNDSFLNRYQKHHKYFAACVWTPSAGAVQAVRMFSSAVPVTDVGFDCQCGLGVGRNWTWNLPKTGPKINDVLDRLLDLIIGLSVAIPSWAPFNLNLGQLWNHSGSQDGFQLGFGADFAFQKRSQNQPKFTENLLWHSTWLLTWFRHNFSNCCWIFPLPLFLKLFLRPHTAH